MWVARTQRWIWASFAVVALAACPDPEARLDEFADATERFRKPPPELGPSVLADLEGRYLLSTRVEIGPATLYFEAEIETNFDGGGCPAEGCLMDMTILPLVSPNVVGVVCDPAFSPAGIALGSEITDEERENPQPIEVRDIPVREDGSFIAQLPLVTVDGCANSISGRPIVAKLVLESVTKSADRFCGNLKGDVTDPLEATLVRSTFGAERIEDDPANLDPRPILEACPAEEDDEDDPS